MFTNLLIKLKTKFKKPKDNFISKLSFEKIRLERRNNCIFYYGKVKENIRLSGIINPDSSGEEFFIISNPLNGFKKIKIKKFKTKLDYNHLKGEYFTTGCLENLTRIRIH